MPPVKDELKKPSVKDSEYLLTYSQHLEKRLRDLETEKVVLEGERLRLEQDLNSLRAELDQISEPALVTATVEDVIDEKRVVIKSSTGPDFVVHLSKQVKTSDLKPGSSVALNQRTLAIVELLPARLDPFIKSMEVINHPKETYEDVGGLHDVLREVREAVELPLLKPELFKKIGIEPPKGILLYGPPGTGKTLIAKAVAHETNAKFIRVIGSELVQKFIGEGAMLVRDLFQLARKEMPSIIFIDEIDAIGASRLEMDTSGDREVQRTLMQLLSEMDGFNERGNVMIIGATNRIDILDLALLRPGRFDRLIEFPIPGPEERKSIFNIHMRNLKIDDKDFNLNRLVDLTEGSTGADIKAMVTEAGMFAIRREANAVTFEDFVKACHKVISKVKGAESESKLYS